MGHKKKKYTAMAAGFLLLFALMAGVAIYFLQPKNQVLFATVNTFKNSQWIPVLSKSKFLQAEGIELEADWNSGSVTGDLQLKIGEEETGISFRAGVLGASVGIKGMLSENDVKLQIPSLRSNGEEEHIIYMHQLNADTPFFDELLGKRNADSVDKVFNALAGFHWKKVGGETVSTTELAWMVNEIGVQKSDSKTYEIDGEEVSCRGFVMEVSKSEWAKEQGLSVETVWVYVYRSKLAAVRIDTGEDMLEIRFLGGENRDSGMMFIKEGQYFLKVKGKQEGEDFSVNLVFENEEGTHIAFRGQLAEDLLEVEIRSAEIKGRDYKLEGDISVVPCLGSGMGEGIFSDEDWAAFSGETVDLEELPEIQKQMMLLVFRLFRVS